MIISLQFITLKNRQIFDNKCDNLTNLCSTKNNILVEHLQNQLNYSELNENRAYPIICNHSKLIIGAFLPLYIIQVS